MTEPVSPDVQAGISLYTRFFLSIYDWYALGYNCRFIWRCPSKYMLALYQEHVSPKHLDIGVGTGYFMARCTFPTEDPDLSLMDLNENSLASAGKRLARYHPKTYLRNALEPFDLPDRYASVGMMNLLHCLPGNMTTKSIVFDYTRQVLEPGGTVFGCTILSKGMRKNFLTGYTLKWVNERGMMTNLDDDIDILAANLKARFAASEIRLKGCVALFWARN